MFGRLLLIVFAVSLGASSTMAQQVHVSTPLVSVNDSFYEWYGIDWGYQSWGKNGGFFFNRGSSQGTIPPFGGFDPNSTARFGFANRGSNHGFFLNFAAAQGSNRTISSTTPSITLSNGAVGSIRDVRMRPFVTGLIPVVGSAPSYRVPAPTLISPLKERLARLREASARPPQSPAKPPANEAQDVAAPPELVLGATKPAERLVLTSGDATSESTAERGDIGVSEIRRRQAAQAELESEELERLIEDAKAAEAVGRFGAARVRYRQAANRASGDVRRTLLERLESIRDR